MARDKPIRDKQDAHNAGQEDYRKCDGKPSNPLHEAIDPSHKPPRDSQEKHDAYKQGWDHAKKQDRKSH